MWKGIPYAAPPVGELRWKPPAAAASWTGIREATGFGAFECESDWRAEAAARYAPAYRFEFDHTYHAPRLAKLGAGHGLDLFMVLGNTPAYAALDADERALSDAMIGYWSRFAHTGDPNGGAAPAWHTGESHDRLIVDTQFHAKSAANERCSTWRIVLDARR